MNLRHLCLAVVLQLAPLPAAAAEWSVDLTRSSIRFSGVQVGIPFSGHFKRFEPKVDFDASKPVSGHVTVLVDLTSARTGDVQRDEFLPKKDWFDAKAASHARFEAVRFIDKGSGQYEAVGALTIRGVSRPLTLPFRLTIDEGRAHATGHVSLVRTDFGVGQGAWASGQWVGLDVGVDIEVVATVSPGAARGDGG